MEYWTIIDDRHAGPFSAEELIAKGVGLDTPVWITGLPDWVEAREIQELRILIEAQQQPADAPEQKPEKGNREDLPPAPVPEPPVYAENTASAAEQPQQDVSQPGMNPQEMPYGYPRQPQPTYPPRGMYGPQGMYPPAGQGVPPRGYYPQGAPQPQRPPQPQWEWQQEAKPIPEGAKIPPAYLAWAIISTVLCCIPLGVPAIVFSTKTKQAIKQGDLEKAEKMSERTQWFIILAIVLGLISMPLQFVFSGLQ